MQATAICQAALNARARRPGGRYLGPSIDAVSRRISAQVCLSHPIL
jgi:hypothetical protein